MPKIGWIVDVTKCIGCHACYTACKAENRTAPRTDWRTVIMRESGVFPSVKREFISLSCNHCDHPACLKACPKKAISKRETDGVVLVDQEKCVGCRNCQFVCPYGAPRIDTVTNKMTKCTACVHRLDAGLQPACVATCLTGAIQFVTDFKLVNGRTPDYFTDRVLTGPNIEFVL